jgi:uncharacterized protein YqhQ
MIFIKSPDNMPDYAKRNFMRIPLFYGGRLSATIPLLVFARILGIIQKRDSARFLDAILIPDTLLPSDDSKPSADTLQVGGQAVIEGVMMRSPDYVSVAVRRPNGSIVLKREKLRPWTKRVRILGLPFIRGGVILIESLVLGVKALNFSSEIAMQDEKGKNQSAKPASGWIIGLTVVFAFLLGLALFFYLPLLLTEWMGIRNGIPFNLVDGCLRLLIFLIYLILISLWKEFRRIFEYHGAEHKSIFAYEADRPLTVNGVKSFTTHHPRCGTSFLLVVMLVSLVVFMMLGRPDSAVDRLIRFLFIPVIGGISYEIIKLSGKKYGKPLAQVLVAPGLWLQRITTKEPDDLQLEVALTALRSALDQKIGNDVETVSAS